ncbi:heat shock protein DnaJ domain protein [Nitzschia inconspicua]|uniref:Heat shock protein DnaJ domain protein n=1 Tax=Nitzschia inconspicua TaxID=303405 RepID=A0A9K3KZF4_9STRA|nr:heat shock protein DnaJ domain protein [Nitzschia inconspicua]
MSSTKNRIPEKDPYEVLEIPFGATDGQISKAYKKLALKLHPDKQVNLGPAQAQEIARRFHDVKEARAFLLDAEHAEDRRQFDAKRESERLRREADAIREQAMSHRRKQMRNELKAKEDAAKSRRQKVQRKGENEDDLEQLRREGKRKRSEFAERDAAQQHEKDLQQELKRQQDQKDLQEALEERQVRLKWDRKKMIPSPSEDSLAKLLSEQFGAVEHVELLGKKGNQALVTFVDYTSCEPCVKFYANSSEMRAKFVGQRKDDEEQDQMQLNQAQSQRRTAESLERRRLRQVEERERLLREMEEEEKCNVGVDKESTTEKISSKVATGRRTNFPLSLPEGMTYEGLSPLTILENLEDEVLKNWITGEKLQSIKVPVDVRDL